VFTGFPGPLRRPGEPDRSTPLLLPKVMKPFLYIFGFEDPFDRKSNETVGTDFESSRLIYILADTEVEALAWGHEISERFVAHLHGDASVSWKQGNFASWIESDANAALSPSTRCVPTVYVGEYPDLDRLDRSDE
jgi:hypothetical protein